MGFPILSTLTLKAKEGMQMNNNNYCRIMLVVMFILSLLVGGNSVFAAKKSLRLASDTPATTNQGKLVTAFIQKVKEKSKGEIDIQFFPGGQLGTGAALASAIKTGTVDMTATGFNGLQTLYPDLSVFQFPYVYRDVHHADRASSPSSPLFKKMNEILIKTSNVRMIGNGYYGTRQLTLNTPARTPADLKGKKLRVQPRPLTIATGEGMGAVATVLSFSELPTGLATGVVDGQENPLRTIYAGKFYQTQKYLMLTDHIIAMAVLAINENVWKSLDKNQQDMFMEAAREAKEEVLKEALAEESDLVEKLRKEGMTVIGPKEGLDKMAFQKSVLKRCRKEFPQWKGYIEEIQAIK
jgi:tripartite ATP-independent transporter DctP family solute receptor